MCVLKVWNFRYVLHYNTWYTKCQFWYLLLILDQYLFGMMGIRLIFCYELQFILDLLPFSPTCAPDVRVGWVSAVHFFFCLLVEWWCYKLLTNLIIGILISTVFTCFTCISYVLHPCHVSDMVSFCMSVRLCVIEIGKYLVNFFLFYF